MTRQVHAQAFLDLLDADNAAPALVVLDGAVPKDQLPPYVLVYFRFVTPDGEQAPDKLDLTLASTVVETHATVHSVAANARAARAVADRALRALLDVTPAVTGRSCFPIRHVDGRDADRDESTGALVFSQVDAYRFTTLPA